MGLFFFSFLCTLLWVIACDHGNSFLYLEEYKKERIMDRDQNGFQCEDNNDNHKTHGSGLIG